MSAYFVTATGTDIGKTFVTAGLIRALRARDRGVGALKPVVSGFAWSAVAASDPGVLLDALGEGATPDTVARISPWRFSAPLSPDMAAAREGATIDFDALVEFCRNAIPADGATLFIEGVGGVMVPLDGRHTVRDWMTALGLPAIVVAGSYLGTISHTLTALDVLARAGVAVAVLVINESEAGTVALDETVATLRRFTAVPVATIPRGAGPDAFAALAARL